MCTVRWAWVHVYVCVCTCVHDLFSAFSSPLPSSPLRSLPHPPVLCGTGLSGQTWRCVEYCQQCRATVTPPTALRLRAVTSHQPGWHHTRYVCTHMHTRTHTHTHTLLHCAALNSHFPLLPLSVSPLVLLCVSQPDLCFTPFYLVSFARSWLKCFATCRKLRRS